MILYGSAAAGEYVPDHSDVNLLCVLGETTFAAIAGLSGVVEWWAGQKHRAPLLMSVEELQRGADVFSIELLDMQSNYRVLAGEDVLKTLVIPMTLHRAQVEYELREKTILLRQRLLMRGTRPQRQVGASAALGAGVCNAGAARADCFGRAGSGVKTGSCARLGGEGRIRRRCLSPDIRRA